MSSVMSMESPLVRSFMSVGQRKPLATAPLAKIRCSTCNLREVCLPNDIATDDETLDDLVPRNLLSVFFSDAFVVDWA